MHGRLILAAGLLFAAACADEEATPPAGGGCRFLGTDEGSGPPTPAAPSDACWTIATVNPLSGPLGTIGLALENAARLAVRDVNAAGGVAGRKLCLVACDDRTDPGGARALATELLDTYKPIAVNGAASSAVSLEIAKVIGPRQVAQVSCCSTSPALSDDPNVLRTVPSDALQGVVLASVARALEPPVGRVATLYIDDSYGRSLERVFSEAFQALGGVVISRQPYTPGAASYTPIFEPLAGSSIDALVAIAFPTDGAQLFRDWRDAGTVPRVRWLATEALRDDRFVVGAAGLGEGLLGTSPVLVGPAFAGFDARYRAAFGGALPGIFNSNQYDAVLLIALAIARAGPGASAAAVRDAIREISRAPGPQVSPDDLAGALRSAASGDVDYVGAAGPQDLDARGDVLSDYAVWSVSSGRISERADCWTCTTSTETAQVRCVPRAGCGAR